MLRLEADHQKFGRRRIAPRPVEPLDDKLSGIQVFEIVVDDDAHPLLARLVFQRALLPQLVVRRRDAHHHVADGVVKVVHRRLLEVVHAMLRHARFLLALRRPRLPPHCRDPRRVVHAEHVPAAVHVLDVGDAGAGKEVGGVEVAHLDEVGPGDSALAGAVLPYDVDGAVQADDHHRLLLFFLGSTEGVNALIHALVLALLLLRRIPVFVVVVLLLRPMHRPIAHNTRALDP
mmetsp:Transcript_10703/g.26862  ORF Transcript_10703/g.26862 Transcript_10703/m.26862 type:complete len:232 (-) Transcript_10703:187-882(-)